MTSLTPFETLILFFVQVLPIAIPVLILHIWRVK